MEACIDADEKAEALKYIPKLSDLVERGEVCSAYNAYVTLGFDIYKSIKAFSVSFIFCGVSGLCSYWNGEGSG